MYEGNPGEIDFDRVMNDLRLFAFLCMVSCFVAYSQLRNVNAGLL